jgi:hypothetical protein
LGRHIRPILGAGLETQAQYSEVSADITISITRIIITIEGKRTCISAVIRVTANMQDVPPKQCVFNPYK